MSALRKRREPKQCPFLGENGALFSQKRHQNGFLMAKCPHQQGTIFQKTALPYKREPIFKISLQESHFSAMLVPFNFLSMGLCITSITVFALYLDLINLLGKEHLV